MSSVTTGAAAQYASGQRLAAGPLVSSLTGDVRWTFPFDLPHGPNGLTPQLELQWNARLPNGVFGRGFHCSIPAIRRLPDGDFELVGRGKLALSSDGCRRLRFDPCSCRVEPDGDGWRLTESTGHTQWFGTGPGSRDTDANASVDTWWLDAIEEPLGGRAVFTYRVVDGVRVPDSIAYGPYRVQFNYEARPDSLIVCAGGAARVLGHRCDRITLQRHDTGQNIRHWRFTYSAARLTGQSLLTRIGLDGVAASGERSTWPDVVLVYEGAAGGAPRIEPISVDNGVPSPPSTARSGTVNWIGKGRPSLFEIDDAGCLLWHPAPGRRLLNAVRATEVPIELLHTPDVTSFADLDGIGRPDLVVMSPTARGRYRLQADGGFSQFEAFLNAPLELLSSRQAAFVDLDGNGMVDMLVTDPAADEVRGYLRDGAGDWQATAVTATVSKGQAPPLSLSDLDVRLADLSGDGQPDFIQLDTDHVLIWPAVGLMRWASAPMRVEIPLPEGIGSLLAARTVFTDLTGDGSGDLLVILPGRIVAFLNRGGSSFSLYADLPVPGLESVDDAIVTDLFGDGLPGVLIWAPGDATQPLGWIRLISDNDVPRVREITNGLGLTTRIEYASSVAMQESDETAGRPWQRYLPFPILVASESAAADAVNGTVQRLTYRYRDGVYSSTFRALLGFGHSTTDESAGCEAPQRRVTFTHALPAPGVITLDDLARGGALLDTSVEERTDEAWKLLQTSHQEWDVVAFPGGEARRRRLVSAATVEHDSDGAPARRLETAFAYDQWDNVVREVQRAADSQNVGASLATDFTYAADPARRFMRKVARIQQVDGSRKLVAHSRLFYDDGPLGTVGASGLLTKVESQAFTDDLATAWAEHIDYEALGYCRLADESGWWRTERQFSRSIDGNGRIVTTTVDALGGRSSTTYDSDQIHPIASVDAAGHRQDTVPDPLANRPAEIREAAGLVRRYQYDGLARPISVSTSTFTNAINRFRTTCGDAGTVVEVDVLADDELATYTQRRALHDGLGREISASLTTHSGSIVERRQRYSLRGLQIEEQDIGAAAPTRFFYDAIGRPRRIERPDGEVEVIRFAGDWIEMGIATDGAVAVTRRVRLDGQRRPIQVVTGDAATEQTVSFERDVRGRVISAQLPGGRRSTWQFDLLGREQTSDLADEGRRTCVYDAEGRLRQVLKGEGLPFDTYAYSAAGAPETRVVGNETVLFAQFVYGAPDDPEPSNRGRLTGVTQEWGTTVYRYTPEGQIAESCYARTGGGELSIRYRYRPDGQVSEIVYPGGRVLRHDYDTAGRLLRIPGFIREVEYGAEGLPGAIVMQNGVRTTIQRLRDGKRVRRLMAEAAGQTLMDVTCDRDARGNVREFTSPEAIWQRTYEYDSLDRIVRERGGALAAIDYRFDDTGRVVESTGTGTMSYTDGRLVRAGARPIEMDDRGRRVRDGDTRFSYSDANHLRSATRSDGVARHYRYGADDQPVVAEDAQGALLWFCPDPHIVETADGSFGFVLLNGVPVARFPLEDGTGSVAYLHANCAGQTAMITDDGGRVVRRTQYSATARVSTSDAGTPIDEALEPCSATVRYSQELELYAHGRRFYDPSSAQFLTADPAVTLPLNPMAWTGYGYLAGNPHRYSDPSGWFLDRVGDFFRGAGESIGQFFNKNGKYILAALAVVAVAVLVIASGGTLGLLLGGMLVGGLVGGISASQRGGDVLMGVLVGMALGGLGAWGGAAAAGAIGTSGLWGAVAAGAVKGAIMGAAVGAAGGYAGGAGTFEQILSATARGAVIGGITGAVLGGAEYSLRGFAGTPPPTAKTVGESGTKRVMDGLQPGGDSSGGTEWLGRSISKAPGDFALGALDAFKDFGAGLLHSGLVSQAGFAVTVGTLTGTDTLGYGDDLISFVLGRGVSGKGGGSF